MKLQNRFKLKTALAIRIQSWIALLMDSILVLVVSEVIEELVMWVITWSLSDVAIHFEAVRWGLQGMRLVLDGMNVVEYGLLALQPLVQISRYLLPQVHQLLSSLQKRMYPYAPHIKHTTNTHKMHGVVAIEQHLGGTTARQCDGVVAWPTLRPCHSVCNDESSHQLFRKRETKNRRLQLTSSYDREYYIYLPERTGTEPINFA